MKTKLINSLGIMGIVFLLMVQGALLYKAGHENAIMEDMEKNG